MLRVIIFNVERGFCAFVLSPNKYTLLIDCGCSTSFSPIKYIVENELSEAKDFEGYKLAKFICTHPHEDHIRDIERLTKSLKPHTIQGWIFDPWDSVKDPDCKDEDAYQSLDDYSHLRDEYTAPATEPDWGMTIWSKGLTPTESKKINEEPHALVNNSSMPVMVEYKGFKIFISGDLMEDGWTELLKRKSFKKVLKRTKVFVTAHHGHKSGFNQDAYDVMGKPLINIVSEKSGDEVYGIYSDEDHSVGIKWDGETRRMISTRGGSIILEINDDGRGKIDQKDFKENIKQEENSS